MKKLLVIFAWIFLYSNTFAFDFNQSNYQIFDENAWIQKRSKSYKKWNNTTFKRVWIQEHY